MTTLFLSRKPTAAGRTWLQIAAVVSTLLCANPCSAASPLPVVATFSILADLVRIVGGERVTVETLIAANTTPHTYAPTPADARKVAEARIVFANGLGFEEWLKRLITNAGAEPRLVEASRGVTPLKNGKDSQSLDPHAWQSVANARIYVENIRDALIEADRASGDVYTTNAAAYLGQLLGLEAEIRTAVDAIPSGRRRAVTPHSAFRYFADAYGLQFIALQQSSHDAETSAKDFAAIITAIRRDRIPAALYENASNRRMMQQLAAETGARLGGPLYSDALTAEEGAAPTYIALIRHNLGVMTQAMKD